MPFTEEVHWTPIEHSSLLLVQHNAFQASPTILEGLVFCLTLRVIYSSNLRPDKLGTRVFLIQGSHTWHSGYGSIPTHGQHVLYSSSSSPIDQSPACSKPSE